MKRITSFVLASATAFSLAFTPAPATADAEDVAAAIAGIAVLGLIAKAASDRDDDRRVVNQRYNSVSNQRIIEGQIINRPVDTRAQRVKRAALPHRCVRQLRTRQGLRPVYGQRCLNQRYQFTSSLPQQCQRLVRTSQGVRTFFSHNCLARDGWNVARL